MGGEVTPVEEMVSNTGALPRDVPDRASSTILNSAPLANSGEKNLGEKITHIDQVLMDEVSTWLG